MMEEKKPHHDHTATIKTSSTPLKYNHRKTTRPLRIDYGKTTRKNNRSHRNKNGQPQKNAKMQYSSAQPAILHEITNLIILTSNGSIIANRP